MGADAKLPVASFMDWLTKQSYFFDKDISLRFRVEDVLGKNISIDKTYKNTKGLAGFLAELAPDSNLLRNHHRVLCAEVLADIALVVADDGLGGELPALLRRERRRPKAQGDVAHRHHDNTLVRRRVLRDAPKAPLQNVVPVKE